MIRRFAILVALVACHGEPAQQPVAKHDMLTASLALARHDYAKDADVEVTVELANSTPNPVTIPAQVLDTAALLLEVSDTKGAKVATTSPPVPKEEKLTFAPNEHKIVKVTLGVFSPTLPSGDYIVAPNPAVANGNPVTFHIR
jgi:hypothetical protein